MAVGIPHACPLAHIAMLYSAHPSLSEAALVPAPAGPGPSHPPEDGRQAGGALVRKGYERAQDTRGPHSNPQTPGPRDTADQPLIPPLPGPRCLLEHGRTHTNTCTHTHSLAHCPSSSPGPGRRPFPFSLHRSLPDSPGIWVQPRSVPPLTCPQERSTLSFKARRATPSPGQVCPEPTRASPPHAG